MREIINYIVVGVIVGFIIYFISPSILNEKISIKEVSRSTYQKSDLKTSYYDTFETVKDSVVTIYTSKTRERKQLWVFNPKNKRWQRKKEKLSGQGSGVIATDKGHVITNAHVIYGYNEILVMDHKGNEFPVKIIGIDPETDLAVMKIDKKHKSILFGKIDSVRTGDVVLAIGNPLGVGQTITQGIISATGRNSINLNTYENFLQTDAAINPGNSGGALVNVNGELIGINTALSSVKGGSDGIGYAIPVNIVKNVLTQIIEKGEVTRGFIGVDAVPDYNGLGVLVKGVFHGGPSDKAGLKIGDIIRKINGKPVNEIKSVQLIVAKFQPGEIISLDIKRENKDLKIDLIVTKRPLRR